MLVVILTICIIGRHVCTNLEKWEGQRKKLLTKKEAISRKLEWARNKQKYKDRVNYKKEIISQIMNFDCNSNLREMEKEIILKLLMRMN